MSYNKVILLGRLTRDPELKYLPSGAAATRLGLAINHTYNDRQTGEKKEEVCFVDADAFGRTAEVMNEYLQKGREVLVEGRLRFQTWETDDGQKRSKHSVFVDRFTFVGGRQEDGMEGGGYGQSQGGSAQPTSGQTTGDSAADDEPPATDDDIPF
jgi:single-strand DNA-binding protein